MKEIDIGLSRFNNSDVVPALNYDPWWINFDTEIHTLFYNLEENNE
jgi:hypothetical protein